MKVRNFLNPIYAVVALVTCQLNAEKIARSPTKMEKYFMLGF